MLPAMAIVRFISMLPYRIRRRRESHVSEPRTNRPDQRSRHRPARPRTRGGDFQRLCRQGQHRPDRRAERLLYFLADLSRRLSIPRTIEFIAVSSYAQQQRLDRRRPPPDGRARQHRRPSRADCRGYRRYRTYAQIPDRHAQVAPAGVDPHLRAAAQGGTGRGRRTDRLRRLSESATNGSSATASTTPNADRTLPYIGTITPDDQ